MVEVQVVTKNARCISASVVSSRNGITMPSSVGNWNPIFVLGS